MICPTLYVLSNQDKEALTKKHGDTIFTNMLSCPVTAPAVPLSTSAVSGGTSNTAASGPVPLGASAPSGPPIASTVGVEFTPHRDISSVGRGLFSAQGAPSSSSNPASAPARATSVQQTPATSGKRPADNQAGPESAKK